MRAWVLAPMLLALAPLPARAAPPDPTIATVLSVASTVVPLAATAALWGTGRGIEEGIRFDLGMVFLGLGAVAGPSVGQFYAGGGTNAVVGLILRSLTGGVMLTGAGLWVRGGESGEGVGTALTLLGGVPTALLAIYDIVDASSTAMESRRKAATAMLLPPPVLNIGGFSLCGAVAGGCSF